MEPIIARISKAGASSKDTELAAGLLTGLGKTRGKRTGTGNASLADPAGVSSFSSMLKENLPAISGDSSKGNASIIAVGHEDVLPSGEPFLRGEDQGTTIWSGEGVPVNGSSGINIRSFLKGLGLQDKQAEEISKEIDNNLLQSAVPPDNNVVWETIADVLRGHGFGEEKIQGLLTGLENGRLIQPLSLKQREEWQGKGGYIPETAQTAKGDAGKVDLHGAVVKISAPSASAETVEGQEGIVTGSTVSLNGGNTAAVSPLSEEGKSLRNEAGKAGTTEAAVKQAVVPNGWEGQVEKERSRINFTLPLPETGVGKDASIEEGAVLSLKGTAEGKEAGVFPTPGKQRPPVFKDHIGEGETEGDTLSQLLERGTAVGRDGRDLPVAETMGKGIRKEEGSDRTTPLPGRNGTAIDMAATGKLVQGNLYAISGSINDTKAETASGPRPEILIDQIVGNAGQFPQNGPGRLKITLNPPHLGTIDMDVLVRNNKVEVVMIASNQEVQQVLKAHADQLKNALQGQGLKVDGFDVLLPGNQGGQGYQFSGGHFTRDGGGEGNGSSEEIETSDSRAGILLPQEMRTEGNNGDTISLFV